jgi:two-component system sensor histidine kinase MtrB
MKFLLSPFQKIRRLWRKSLRLRIVTFSVALSLIAVATIGSLLTANIEQNLFESRKDQIVSGTKAVVRSVKGVLDSSVRSDGTIDIKSANTDIQTTIGATSSAPGLIGYSLAIPKTGDQSKLSMGNASVGFPDSVITDELKKLIESNQENVYYQSVELANGAAGLAIGSTIFVPTQGNYDLLFVYGLSDLEETLTFIQIALLIGGAFFVVVTGVIIAFVTNRAIAPIVQTAKTAERFAKGHLQERVEVSGEDIVSNLAESFNFMAESIEQQINRLATLSRLQQQFVSDVSHELRTPLTTIKLAGSMLFERRSAFDKDAAKSAELLQRQISTFETLLAELLEISRTDAGASELEIDEVIPAELAEFCVENISELAKSNGCELRINDSFGPEKVRLDPRRVRRIITNFLSNALDHGAGKPIEINISKAKHSVRFEVKDYGIGMTAEQTERVFDRFWRADSSRQRKTGGTGLGLSIAKADAELHGGNIEVFSSPGLGASFVLSIPLRGAIGKSATEPVLDEAPENV